MNASEQITAYIDAHADWRGKLLARLRKLILDASPGIVEEWKWNVPVWSHNGNVVGGAVFQGYVKLNFFKGAQIQDPQHLFNAGLEAKTSRAIDIHQGDKLNEPALKKLIQDAVALNAKPQKAAKKTK